MATRYFFKELPENPLRLSNGVPLKFEILATEDATLIAELEMAMARHVGGVVEVKKEEYEELLKKKETPTPREPRAFPFLGPSVLPPRVAASVVAAEPPKVTGGPLNPGHPQLNQPEPLRVPEFKTIKAADLNPA